MIVEYIVKVQPTDTEHSLHAYTVLKGVSGSDYVNIVIPMDYIERNKN